MFLAIGIIAIVFAVVMIAILYSEEKDKQYRRLSGLPPKRYHDITDLDSTELHLQNIEQALWKKK